MQSRSILAATLFAAVGLACSTAHAQSCTLSEVSWLPTEGEAGQIILDGDIAYMADLDGGARLIDVSDPQHPSLLSTINPAWVYGIDLVGTTLYAAGSNAQTSAWDVSNPAAPTLLGAIEVSNVAHTAVAVEGNTAYLCLNANGIAAVDVSTPANMSILSTMNQSGIGRDIQIRDGLAYVANKTEGLRIYDVSNPSNLRRLSTTPTGGQQCLDIEVDGNYAYLCDSYIQNGTAPGLVIVDITDPRSPFVVATLDLPGFEMKAKIVGSTAYVASDAFVHVVDITDPANPYLLSTFDPPDWYARGVAATEDFAFLAGHRAATSHNGLHVLSVHGCSDECPADLNDDGTLNTQDFLVFLGLWSQSDNQADWNQDGTINTQDFTAYLNDWTAGC